MIRPSPSLRSIAIDILAFTPWHRSHVAPSLTFDTSTDVSFSFSSPYSSIGHLVYHLRIFSSSSLFSSFSPHPFHPAIQNHYPILSPIIAPPVPRFRRHPHPTAVVVVVSRTVLHWPTVFYSWSLLRLYQLPTLRFVFVFVFAHIRIRFRAPVGYVSGSKPAYGLIFSASLDQLHRYLALLFRTTALSAFLYRTIPAIMNSIVFNHCFVCSRSRSS